MKFAKCLENRRFPCYNNTNAKSVPSGAQANRTGSGRAYMNCAEIRRLPWLIRLLTSALLAALVLTPAPLALSAWATESSKLMQISASAAVPAQVSAPLVLSQRINFRLKMQPWKGISENEMPFLFFCFIFIILFWIHGCIFWLFLQPSFGLFP